MSSTRKENERTKLLQEKCQTLLTQMLRDEDNKYCVDCDAKGPRWASWNIGIFLCIRCAGIHRNLGVHISRVKSVNLDTWTPEQVISLQQMGNSRARAVYEAQLPDGFRRPQTDSALENFIRAKYEHKKYLAKEWLPTPPPKVDWNKEIDEEIERQKRKKKPGTTLTLSSVTDKKKSNLNQVKTELPILSKPVASSSVKPLNEEKSLNLDLLSLASPTLTVENNKNDLLIDNDIFSNFLSATVITEDVKVEKKETDNSLDKQEADFFNQPTQNEMEKAKLTKDNIMALYGNFNTPPNISGMNNPISFAPKISQNPQPNLQFGQQFNNMGMLGQIVQPLNKNLECNVPQNHQNLFSMDQIHPNFNRNITNNSDKSVFNNTANGFTQFPVQTLTPNATNLTRQDPVLAKQQLEQINFGNIWQNN